MIYIIAELQTLQTSCVRYRKSRLVKNGSSRGQRQMLCRACGRSISVRYGTAYSDLEADASIFDLAFRALAEGNSLILTDFVFHAQSGFQPLPTLNQSNSGTHIPDK
jgi:hypothetical protein